MKKNIEEILDKPVFISGHPRSGTNLLMRLLDGSKSLLTPIGEGKINALRRLSWKNGHDIENADIRFTRILNTVEFNMDNDKLNRFKEKLEVALREENNVGFKADLKAIIHALWLFNYGENDFKYKRWLEKNHNIEFYWGRALLAFFDPKLLVMMRDPRDVWGSWKELCKKHNLDTSKTQMRRNLQQHLVEEIIESSHGVSRFNNLKDIQDYYKVPAKNVSQLHQCITEVMYDGIHSNNINVEIIDVDAFIHSNSEAGRFSWNYRIIAERSIWLTENYGTNSSIVCYENLVRSPTEVVKWIAEFCELNAPDTIDPTEIGEQWSGNSSFTSSFKGVSTDSVGRWRQRLNATEVESIEDVALTIYNNAAQWQEKTLQLK